MTKFNIGDRVRFRDTEAAAFRLPKGTTATVVKGEYTTKYGTFIDVEWDREVSMAHGGWFPRRFELAPVKSATPKAKRIGEFKKGGRCDQLLRFLTTGRTITQGEAIVLGFGTRLAATVHDLRAAGHNVVTSMKEDCHGNPYAEYRLVTRKANGDRKAA